jgi:membrane-associated phospholipid phosphatase
MPPIYAQDPLSALQRGEAWRFVDVAAAVAGAGSQPWVLALVALALYAWLELEVKDVARAFLPLAIGLCVAAALATLGRALGAVPRPAGAGQGAAGLLRALFPAGHEAAVATFAVYSLLAYGRRARAALLLGLALAAARAVSGAHWAADLAGGVLAGAALGALAYLAVLRLFPEGHLARLRQRRNGRGAARLASRPSA